ncbi:HU family DNA-binding protein [Kitasatospora sp. NPDC006697]|uniref:HU family DNA-binding protein n=1 Tax=Kitasatospora sp. NPDC006697 TaxID=3364020 RepID=UPI003698A7D3
MNKGQLVEAVAGSLGSRAAAEDAVDAVLDAMVRAVVAGDTVQVTGFGTLEPVHRPARYARNPQTGERVRVKKTTVPRFRPGQGFKDLVSGTKKLPKEGPATMKAPKGSLMRGTSAAPAAAAKRTTAKRAGATAATTVGRKTATAKKAPAKKTTTRTTAPARTAPARKAATAKKAPSAKRTAPRVAR